MAYESGVDVMFLLAISNSRHAAAGSQPRSWTSSTLDIPVPAWSATEFQKTATEDGEDFAA